MDESHKPTYEELEKALKVFFEIHMPQEEIERQYLAALTGFQMKEKV